jgi:hypothetical protein
MLCLPYYCLCLLFNKIGEEGRAGSAWTEGGWGGERGGGGQGCEMAQTMYAHMNKWINNQKKYRTLNLMNKREASCNNYLRILNR